MPRQFSRRAVLGQITTASMAAAAGWPAKHAFAALDTEPWYFLTDAEARWLAAVVDVFIPEDEYPSASQAGVVDFIDLQLATDYGKGAGLYLEGPFPQGAPEQGWQVPFTPAELIRKGIAGLAEEGDVTGMDTAGRAAYVQALFEREGMIGQVHAGTFFTELLTLTNEGYFADPIYRGNARYAGWEMVGFPGAHAYYLESVDAHNRPYRKPPKGIAHDPNGPATLPRVIPEGA